MDDKPPSSVDHPARSVVDALQWVTAKVFGVSLHDLAFGTTTLHINDYPQQLRLARTAALYLCRKHTGRRPPSRGPSTVDPRQLHTRCVPSSGCSRRNHDWANC